MMTMLTQAKQFLENNQPRLSDETWPRASYFENIISLCFIESIGFFINQQKINLNSTFLKEHCVIIYGDESSPNIKSYNKYGNPKFY